MNREQRGRWVAGLLLGAWLLVVAWQVTEHRRVVEAAKSDLRNRSREIARTLGAVTRALRFRGAVFQERLDPVLNELASTRTNALVRTTQLLALGLVNNDGDTVVAVGETNLISRESAGESERWSDENVVFVLPIEGAAVNPEGVTNNPTVVLPSPPRNFTNGPSRNERDGQRHGPFPDGGTNIADFSTNNFPAPPTNASGQIEPPPDEGGRPPGGDRQRGGGNRRPPWMRGMSEADFKALIAKRELHGLVLVMSTENYRALCTHDWWLRFVVGFFAGIAALGAGLSWRNTARTADLQIRLVRASEQNSHLKELSLAAAGLAHETRNPLNIIRGQAQMLARLPDITPEVRAQSKTIVDQTDKVTAQLTEFINYSRPREVRRTKVALAAVGAEVVRTLNFDAEEKKLKLEVTGETLSVEADEQLLRQVLFNLLLNAIQAANDGGKIQMVVLRAANQEAILEIRDDGPGVPPENRQEIFKPYFTTHQKGTGLGLAVVQQIVHAHGWDIVCVANDPRGAVFRITHLKVV
ncbi:MAG TPA: ATP-binding protein [Verrucomicrobiae bacterium]|nr:ATP-binding protein [Verrucomicrobiae bacterium]